ncbi:M23 family metallopeptidase [Halobacillus campisalis]|uniref:Peptidoglycan DD-metalloendopeptidase family protein n=1 Tax=Halobacillus campisalis TaxID=435909 RepID=A0ABW2K2U8_9BACI|nr:M23 family metallopeptidase [Halobacillus campisalis]
MKKNINDVRKNIAERKRKKVITSRTPTTHKGISGPQDEEMHGYPPFAVSDGFKQSSKKSASLFGVQALASVLLFGVVFISEQSSSAVAEQPREWVSSQLQEEFPFAKVTAWYSDRFGGPLQLVQPKEEQQSVNVALPVNGTVTEPFENHGRGIIMSTAQGEEVKSIKEGTVIFAGNDPETKKTVIIQHQDDSNTIYGFLSTIDVHLYEHIQAQETVGLLNEKDGNEFFFAIEKDKQYLDPAAVIKVDGDS